MRNWRAVQGQSVPNIVRNITTKHNPATLPINLYAAGPLDIQPLDLTVMTSLLQKLQKIKLMNAR